MNNITLQAQEEKDPRVDAEPLTHGRVVSVLLYRDGLLPNAGHKSHRLDLNPEEAAVLLEHYRCPGHQTFINADVRIKTGTLIREVDLVLCIPETGSPKLEPEGGRTLRHYVFDALFSTVNNWTESDVKRYTYPLDYYENMLARICAGEEVK